MTQHARIEAYMREHGSITPYEAFAELGITKLSTRIGEMIARGLHIRKEKVKAVNRYGENISYVRYSIAE